MTGEETDDGGAEIASPGVRSKGMGRTDSSGGNCGEVGDSAHRHAPMSVGVRPALPGDAAAIASLVDAAYTPYLARMPRRPAPMDDDPAEAIGAADVWVAERDGVHGIVGVVVVRRAEDHLLVDNLAVHPSAQGRGVGAALLDLVDEFACTTGIDEIRLYTNVAMTENLAYYPRHGFVETHRAVQDGFARVFFTKYVDHDGL